MLKIEIIDNFDKFVSLEPVWNKLLSYSDADNIFMTFEWLSCWWRSYGEGNKMMIYLVREDNEIVAIAPLMRTVTKFRGLPVRAITFITNDHSGRTGLILIKKKKEIVNLMLQRLFQDNKVDMFSSDYIVNNSYTDLFLTEAADENNFKYRKKQSILSPYVPIEGEWDAYFKNRSQKLRQNLRYINNTLKNRGTYEAVKYSVADVPKAMEEILAISKKTWKYKAKTAIAYSKKHTLFYNYLAEIASLRGWLAIWVLKIDNKPVAFAFTLVYKDKCYLLKTGFDEEYSKFSPSSFLESIVTKDCFDKRFKEFDLLGQNEKYKTKWTSLIREHCEYCILGNTIYAKLLGFLEFKLIPILKKIGFGKKRLTLSTN